MVKGYRMVASNNRLFTRWIDIMHDIEKGHDCPRCTKTSRCTIEDGYCDNQGECDTCLKERYYREDSDNWLYDPDPEEYEHEYDRECECEHCRMELWIRDGVE